MIKHFGFGRKYAFDIGVKLMIICKPTNTPSGFKKHINERSGKHIQILPGMYRKLVRKLNYLAINICILRSLVI